MNSKKLGRKKSLLKHQKSEPTAAHHTFDQNDIYLTTNTPPTKHTVTNGFNSLRKIFKISNNTSSRQLFSSKQKQQKGEVDIFTNKQIIITENGVGRR